MALKPSAPPLSAAYEPLAGHCEARTDKRTSSSTQILRYEHQQEPGYAAEPDHRRSVSDSQHHRQLGFTRGPGSQPHEGPLQYPSVVAPQCDAPVVFGFPVAPPSANPRWQTGLCACCSDPTTCLVGCCCPCVLFGKIAEDLDNGATSCAAAAAVWYLLQQFTSCGWLYSYGYRRKLRSRYGFRQRPGCDCIVHCCCWSCAFCQEYREIHIRRLQNEAFWERYVTLAPPSEQMMRH